MKFPNEDIINDRIVSFFEKGHIKEALVGEGEYFTYNRDYPDNSDFGLVVSQLISWTDKEKKYRESALAFEEAIDELIRLKRYENLLRLLWSYFVSIKPEYKLYEDEIPFEIDYESIKNKIKFILVGTIEELFPLIDETDPCREKRKEWPKSQEIKDLKDSVKEVFNEKGFL